MKQIIVVLFFMSAAFAQDLLTDVDDETKECLKELNMKSDQVRDLDSLEEISKMTKDEKCLLRCVMKKVGIIDEEGNLVEEELMDDEILESMDIDVSKCTLQTAITDPCEQNYLLTVCVVEVMTEAAAREN